METNPDIDTTIDEHADDTVDSDSLIDVLEKLRKGERVVQLSPNEDIVLLLGNTGSGKSTLAQFLAGNNEQLISIEVGEESGEFLIVDKNGKISNNSTIVSQTIYPELMFSESNRAIYYDCPGFSDTRSAATDIAGTYFVKKVVDAARSVKLIFVINYPSVRKGVDRQDFMLMVKHAVKLVRDMKKYSESIALIVTKVDNQYINGGKTLVSDYKIIKNIADFIQEVKQELETKSRLQIEGFDPQYFYNSAIEFVNSLLVKNADKKYKKIGIFRRPDKAGRLSEDELLQDGKKSLLEIIHTHTKFGKRNDNDFGYTISAESKNQVYWLIEEIIKTMTIDIASIGIEMEEQYNSNEEWAADIDKLQEHLDFALKSFMKIHQIAVTQEITPSDFIRHIYSVTKKLNMSISEKYFSSFVEHDGYLRFLHDVSNKPPKNVTNFLVNGLDPHLQYLRESKNWYTFLSNLYNRLSEYDVQKNIANFHVSKLLKQMSITPEKVHVKISDILTEFPISTMNVTGFNAIKDIHLDEIKQLSLMKVMNTTLNHEVEFKCAGPNELMIKGEYIKLSDVTEKHCSHNGMNLKFLEIYATNKVFIDKSMQKTGDKFQFVMMAPTWEVIGEQEIVLDGMPGKDHDSKKASSGSYYGPAYDGKPGFPGGSAGSFVGVGKHFIKGFNLKISASGGAGGRGQDGGDGANSEERSGGNGGDGGMGGSGGHEGQVSIIELGTGASEIRVSKGPGAEGEGGSGGRGGRGGIIVLEPGRTWMQWVPGLNIIDAAIARNEGTKKVPQSDGREGQKGYNDEGRERPEPPVGFIDPTPFIKKFMNYLAEKSIIKGKKSFFQDFITQLNNTDIIRQKRSINANENSAILNGVINEEMIAEQWKEFILNRKESNDYKSVGTLLYPPKQFNIYDEQDPSVRGNEIPWKKDNQIMATLDRLQKYSANDYLDQKSISTFNPYSDLSSNLLLWDVLIKKFTKNRNKPSKTYASEIGSKDTFASDLAYRYYIPK